MKILFVIGAIIEFMTMCGTLHVFPKGTYIKTINSGDVFAKNEFADNRSVHFNNTAVNDSKMSHRVSENYALHAPEQNTTTVKAVNVTIISYYGLLMLLSETIVILVLCMTVDCKKTREFPSVPANVVIA